MNFGPDLLLRQPRVIDSSPFSIRVIYDAYVFGEQASALCDIQHPPRLAHPFFSPIIQRSIAHPAG